MYVSTHTNDTAMAIIPNKKIIYTNTFHKLFQSFKMRIFENPSLTCLYIRAISTCSENLKWTGIVVSAERWSVVEHYTHDNMYIDVIWFGCFKQGNVL